MRGQGRIFVGALVILMGINFLFDLDLFRIIFAGIIIFIGVRIITGRQGEFDISEKTEAEEDEIDRVLIFSGINKKFVSGNFKRAEVVAIFGGGEIDLSEVKTKTKELTLEFTAVFGGLKVILPKTWSVRSEGVGILGGYDIKTKVSGKKTADAKIKGAAIFGAVEIVN